MAESKSPEKSFLEINQIAPVIQEEILLPSVAKDSSDIEILEENITKKTLKKKRKNKIKNDSHILKKLNSAQDPDAVTDVCGLKVSIKSLLQNEEIRKQIAPFIQEVVIDCTDSDVEDNNASTELTDEQILDKVKDRVAKSLPKQKKKVKSAKRKHINNHLTVNKKVVDNNKSHIAEKIHVLDLTNDISDDDVTLSQRIDNKKTEKRTKTKSDQNSIILDNHSETRIVDENIFVIHGLAQSQEDIETKNNIPDVPITDSDDWYYLNMGSAPKESSIEDDILIIQNSLKANEYINNLKADEELLPSPSNNTESLLLTPNDKIETLLPTPSHKIETLLPTPRNKMKTLLSTSNKKIKTLPTNKTKTSLPTPSDKMETALLSPSAVAVRRKRRGRKRKPWTIYGKQNVKQDIKMQAANVNTKNDKQISSNLGNDNSVVIGSQIDDQTDEKTTCFINGDIERDTNSKERLTFSHELIPIIKKETESADNLSSEVPLPVDVAASNNKIDSNDDADWSLSNNALKPMLKPYRIKEINEDFYRDEEKIYKTYQKNSARSTVVRKLRKKDKTFFKKRARLSFQCSNCGKKYERSQFLQRHEKICKTKTVETDFQCPQCPYKTSWRYQYQAHVATHLVDEKVMIGYERYLKVQCTVCKLQRPAKQRESKCIKCQSYYEYLCRLCGRDYTTYGNLRTHVTRNIPLGVGRTCHKCNRGGFAALCALKLHIRECEGLPVGDQGNIISGKIPYVRLVRHDKEQPKESYQMNVHCSNCDVFSTTSAREAKCETCCTDMTYKCELCNAFLPSYSDLQSHVLNVHIMSTEMCFENKNETEDSEEKIDCNEIDYSSDEGRQINNYKQCFLEEKGACTDSDIPNNQKSESNLAETDDQTLDIFDKFRESLKGHAVLEQSVQDDETDESNDGLNKASISKFSGDKNIKVDDDTLSDIVNSNVKKEKMGDSRLNEKCSEDKKEVDSFKQKYKTNGIKRYCLRCDKTRKDLDVIRIGPKKEICEKCRSELLYQCVKCRRKSKNYSLMMYHWKHYCALLRPQQSTVLVKLGAPEKYNDSNVCNKRQRHQCRLCPYSSILKSRLMLHLQMHSWKDIKRAVLQPENHSDTVS